MLNFVHDSESPITAVHTSAVVAGRPVVLGALIVIPVVNAAANQEFTAYTEGVFRLPKVTTAAHAQGQKVYWDADGGPNSEGGVSASASGNSLIGRVVEAAASGDEEVKVLVSQQL